MTKFRVSVGSRGGVYLSSYNDSMNRTEHISIPPKQLLSVIELLISAEESISKNNGNLVTGK